jgi:hypothetical protein
MSQWMRIYALGGVVAVIVGGLFAAVTLLGGAEEARQSAAASVEAIAELQAVQAEVAVLRAQRRQLAETAVSGESIAVLVRGVLGEPSRYTLREEQSRVDSQLTRERVDVEVTALPAATLAELIEAVGGVEPPYRLVSAALKATQGKQQSVDGSVSLERVRRGE